MKSQEKVNHFMYTDGTKIFAKNEKEPETLIQTIRIYCQNNRMEFGIEKNSMLKMTNEKREKMGGVEKKTIKT